MRSPAGLGSSARPGGPTIGGRIWCGRQRYPAARPKGRAGADGAAAPSGRTGRSDAGPSASTTSSTRPGHGRWRASNKQSRGTGRRCPALPQPRCPPSRFPRGGRSDCRGVARVVPPADQSRRRERAVGVGPVGLRAEVVAGDLARVWTAAGGEAVSLCVLGACDHRVGVARHPAGTARSMGWTTIRAGVAAMRTLPWTCSVLCVSLCTPAGAQTLVGALALDEGQGRRVRLGDGPRDGGGRA